MYRDASPQSAAPARTAFLDQLTQMTPAERLRAYRAGAFSRRELTIWAARYPEEVPLVNGELPWLALSLADLD